MEDTSERTDQGELNVFNEEVKFSDNTAIDHSGKDVETSVEHGTNSKFSESNSSLRRNKCPVEEAGSISKAFMW